MGYYIPGGYNNKDVCQGVKVRKLHPCNKCGLPIVNKSKVYKHSGWLKGGYGQQYPVWFYLCESCHLLNGLSDTPCDIEKKEWDPAVFEVDGIEYVRAFGKLETLAPDVQCLLIGGKLIWERK